MDIHVSAPPGATKGRIAWGTRETACALGRTGIRADKREGDGATPAGTFPLRRLLYRADRLMHPACGLPSLAIGRDDGWCDDPADGRYNKPVSLPYPARHENLWRDDDLYDLVVVIGYNDEPVVPGLGSAVFVHLARPGFAPTEGCVALGRADMLDLLADCGPGDRLHIRVT